MKLLTFDINTGTEYQHQRYDNEKERRHIIDQARNDMRNTHGSSVWWVDVTPAGITTGPVEGQ